MKTDEEQTKIEEVDEEEEEKRKRKRGEGAVIRVGAWPGARTRRGGHSASARRTFPRPHHHSPAH